MEEIHEDPVSSEQNQSVESDNIIPDYEASAVQMTGYMAIKVRINGRTRLLWQDIRGGVALGFVDDKARPVVLEGVFEASVVDGVLLENLATKGDEE